MKTGNKTENNKLLLWPLVNWLNLKVNVNITSSCVLCVWWLSIWSCWQWESTQRLAAYDVTGGLSWMMSSCSWLTFPRAADPSSHRMRITQKSALERSVQTYILHVHMDTVKTRCVHMLFCRCRTHRVPLCCSEFFCWFHRELLLVCRWCLLGGILLLSSVLLVLFLLFESWVH